MYKHTHTQTHILCIHWSATTLKTLTGGLNNVDPLITRQCCARKSWVHLLMWMFSDMFRPSTHHRRTQRHTLKAVASPAGQCTLSEPWRSHSGFTFPGFFTIPDQFWQCSRAHRPDIRTCHCHDRLYFVDVTLSKICIQRWEMVLSPFLWKLLSRCSWSLPAGAGSQGGIVRVRCWHLARPLPRLLMPAWSIYPSISIFISIYSIYVMPMCAEWRLIMCHCCTMHLLCKWSEEDFLHHSIFRGSVCLRDEMKPNLEYLLSAS